jgi:hypothetical protein
MCYRSHSICAEQPIFANNLRLYNYRAIQQFFAWAERAGYQGLEDIEPITVAAYIETLQRQSAVGKSAPMGRDTAEDWKWGVPPS